MSEEVVKRNVDELLDIDPAPRQEVQKAKNTLAEVRENFNTVFGNDSRFDEDFEDVRDNVKNVILEVSDNIQKLSLIAQDSERASHFTALASLTTTLLQANKQLLEIYKEKQKYKSKREPEERTPSENINVQNAVFTGTTAEFREFLAKMRKE